MFQNILTTLLESINLFQQIKSILSDMLHYTGITCKHIMLFYYVNIFDAGLTKGGLHGISHIATYMDFIDTHRNHPNFV